MKKLKNTASVPFIRRNVGMLAISFRFDGSSLPIEIPFPQNFPRYKRHLISMTARAEVSTQVFAVPKSIGVLHGDLHAATRASVILLRY